MEQFPRSFNFNESNELLQNFICANKKLDLDVTRGDLARLRIFIYHKYQSAIVKDHKEYFMLNLKHYKPIIRETLIKELLQRFPTIGYLSYFPENFLENNPNMTAAGLCDFLFNKSTMTPKFKYVKKIHLNSINMAAESEEYIIACTENFATELFTSRFESEDK
jgi:hypothetical protein